MNIEEIYGSLAIDKETVIYQWFAEIVSRIKDFADDLDAMKTNIEPMLEGICDIDDWPDTHLKNAVGNLKMFYASLETRSRHFCSIMSVSVLYPLSTVTLLQNYSDLPVEEKESIYKRDLALCADALKCDKFPSVDELDRYSRDISEAAESISLHLATLRTDFEHTAFKINSSFDYILR